jgi:acetyltransferase
MPQDVRLLDGTLVTIRPIQPNDAPRLQAFYDRLSQDSLYLRFLQYRNALSHQEAVRLATVDYHRQMALVATRIENARQDIIAVARYAMSQSNGIVWAEPGIVVDDRYQGRGLGVLLLKWLSIYASSHGVQAFRATVTPNNMQMLRIITRSRLWVEKDFQSGMWDIAIDLSSAPDP